MQQRDLRTYRRREVTRTSGYRTCDETTGGECRIVYAERYVCDENSVIFTFSRSSLELVELFENGISIIAFGGYIYAEKTAEVTFEMSYCYEGQGYAYGDGCDYTLTAGNWSNVGLHVEHTNNKDSQVIDVIVRMKITSQGGNVFDFISFDFDIITKEEYLDTSCAVSFYQFTNMHIPYLYYLRSDLPFDWRLSSEHDFRKGRRVILKSSNRCGRYLPINMDDELRTLSFSLHCKKRAPCIHSTFRLYKVQNASELSPDDYYGLTLLDNKVVSYYGHQLECKACKKFFVNAPLNPQRNAQQFKEDGLRRRAFEVLVNELQERNLVHFEFEKRTKKEFSEYIWKKFDKRCFKCGSDSPPILLKEMALDHTMPLAYLYRLDEHATCLCGIHNSQKSDHFPVDFYSEDELAKLSSITGLSLSTLQSKEVCSISLDLLVSNVVWFYDEFLMRPDFQKIRDGIMTADKIHDALKRVVNHKVDLVDIYWKNTGSLPKSVTI